MKKTMLGFVALALALAFFIPQGFAQQQAAAQTGGWYCPWMNTGPGYYPCWGGPGAMRGRWGHHQWMGPCMMYGGPAWGQATPLTQDQVSSLLNNYLNNLGNPNLKLGSIEDKGSFFEGKIVTQEDSLVEKIQVDKNTGWLRKTY